MPTRDSAPFGAPCWTDLWTSDVDGSRKFYAELFGWEAAEPSPEFGGYFMFLRDGVPIAGGMGDMGEMKANDAWKIYLASGDMQKTVEATEHAGGHIVFPPQPVADLGVQAVLTDVNGAFVGSWEPKAFPGFTVIEEHGAPCWFELHTRNHAAAVAFYEAAFGWRTEAMSDTDEFRYTTAVDSNGRQFAGVMDASGFLPDGVPDYWTVYFMADDVDAAVRSTTALGGSVVMVAEDTPYGRIATVADPSGAIFRLIRPPR